MVMLYTEILTSCISNPANLSLYILCFAALKLLFYKHIRHRHILCYKLTPLKIFKKKIHISL